VYGITLVSELRLALPELAEEVSKNVAVELRVVDPDSFRPLVVQPDDPGEWIQHTILPDGALYMRWENWVEFLVSPDGRVVLCGDVGIEALESVEAYLVNFAVSAALLLQGEEPLHATVVEIGGCVVGLIGPSGAGKSTLAAHLISQGADLVTDDMLRVTFEGNSALAHPGPHRLKLFEEPAERYLPSAICRGRFNPLSNKLIFQLDDCKAAKAARSLSAIFSLGLGHDDSTPTVTRLTGSDLFRAIASSTMNSRFNSTARLHRQFIFTERLARLVPIYRLTYSRHYHTLKIVTDRIIESSRQ
jgi:hypothetical protein